MKADVAANGRTTSKGKGKAKAEPPSKTSRTAVEAMEVDDEVEVIEDTGEGVVTKPTVRGANSKATKSATTTTRPAKHDKELSRLKQKLTEVRLTSLFLCFSVHGSNHRLNCKIRRRRNEIHYRISWRNCFKCDTQQQRNHSTINPHSMRHA